MSLGTIISAFWILAANAWMQNPVGYRINPVTGRAELESFLDLVRNPVAWYHLGHTVLAAALTAGVLVLAVSGWHLLRHPESPVFRASVGAGRGPGAGLQPGRGHDRPLPGPGGRPTSSP